MEHALDQYNKAVDSMTIAVEHLRNGRVKKETQLNASQSIVLDADLVTQSMKNIQDRLLPSPSRKKSPRRKHKKTRRQTRA